MIDDTLRTLEDLAFIFDTAGARATNPHVQHKWLKIAEHMRDAARLHREADALREKAELTLHVCGGTQARVCPVTKQPHDMSAVVRGDNWESVACKDCGATAMDMDLLEMP